MAAIRLQVIRSCSFPAFMGAWFAQSLPVRMLIAIPSALLALTAMLPLRASPRPPYEFAALFPQARLEAMFFTISTLVLIAYLVAMSRFVRALRAGGASGRILPALGPVLLEILLHRRFAKCDTKKGRNLGHMFVLLAFAGLALMGTMVGVGTMIGAMHTPLAMLNPLKLFANFCSILAVVGVVMLIVNRLRPEARALSASFDWSLLLTLGMVFATGLLSEALRLLQVELAMYAVYFIHLTLVFALFLNAPYGKFAHFFYRTVAMAATWEKPPRLELAASLSEPE
jgi:quinone-modifying oxidoreductase subunit QmoC